MLYLRIDIQRGSAPPRGAAALSSSFSMLPERRDLDGAPYLRAAAEWVMCV